MDADDFVMLGMLAVGGEIKGKTKLQKTMFFLGVMTNHREELGYRPHFYGPYSQDVADAVDHLRALRFVDQNICGGGVISESGFELSRYDYRLNDDGKKVAELRKTQDPESWTSIEQAAARLKQAGELNYMKLSVAAKTFFLLGQGNAPATEIELARLASRFGWHVKEREVKEAAEYLQKLGLAVLAN